MSNPRRASIERRTILGGIAAVTFGGLGIAAGFVANTFRFRPARDWLVVGRAEDLHADTFHLHVLPVVQRHAWKRERRQVAVWIKDLYPDDPIALLGVCTHLGCAVAWQQSEFVCPCHGGKYDAQGSVTGGPPPQPLARCEVKIENEICYLRLPTGGNA